MEMELTAQSQAPHLAILPSPGMGHLIPLLEFSKRLIHHHNFIITFLLPSLTSLSSKSLQSLFISLPDSIKYIFLPPPNLEDLKPDSKMETILSLSISRSLPSLEEKLESLALESNLIGLIVDLFSVEAFHVAEKLNLFHYLFFPSSAMSLSFCLHLPKLDEIIPFPCEFRDFPKLIEIPGCVSIHGKDLPDSVQERRNEAYKWAIHRTKLFKSANGILLNSFEDLESDAIKALNGNVNGNPNPPIYAIGPLVKKMDSKFSDEMGILKWLDSQPNQSVVFISFGSGGTLSNKQIKELALGLEMSDQRFLWIARNPNEKVSNGAFFGDQTQNGKEDQSKDPFDFLPNGFIERTKERGLVIQSWAPQPQILSHDSIGGFISHCGWNSILESVVNGVPLIAWPLYAEQKMNAVLLKESLGVALRPNGVGENGIVEREEVSGLVKDLILGEGGNGVRRKMKDLKFLAARVVSEDGSSTKTLSELALKWSSEHGEVRTYNQ